MSSRVSVSSSYTYIFLHFSGFFTKIRLSCIHIINQNLVTKWDEQPLLHKLITYKLIIHKKNQKRKHFFLFVLRLLLWLIQTNKYASNSVYICLVANEMNSSEMCAEGKALAEGRIMKIDEKHKEMNRTKSEWISVSPWGEQMGGLRRWRQVTMAITAHCYI